MQKQRPGSGAKTNGASVMNQIEMSLYGTSCAEHHIRGTDPAAWVLAWIRLAIDDDGSWVQWVQGCGSHRQA